VPKPPGTAAVLPRAIGKKRSSARWPVVSGVPARSLAATGRGRRTGQRRASSGTGAGSNGNRRSAGRVSSRAPGAIQSPAPARRRSIPSKTPPRSPGPSSAASGAPVAAAGSPGASPPVYSYTCTVARSPSIAITSPGSRASPSSTSSSMATPPKPSTSTTGPLTRTIRGFVMTDAGVLRAPAPDASGPQPLHLAPEPLEAPLGERVERVVDAPRPGAGAHAARLGRVELEHGVRPELGARGLGEPRQERRVARVVPEGAGGGVGLGGEPLVELALRGEPERL